MQENLVLENVHFNTCDFYHCNLSDTITDPCDASLMKNCYFENCTINENCHVGNGILDNIKFKNFKTKDSLLFSGALFNNVSFTGKCGRFKLSSHTTQRTVNNGKILTQEQISNLNIAADAYYKNINWALDIREAEFAEFLISDNIPAHLVRVNCLTQVIVRKNTMSMQKIEGNPYIFDAHKKLLLSSTKDCVIVVATIDNKYEKEELESIKVLKGEGLAQCE